MDSSAEESNDNDSSPTMVETGTGKCEVPNAASRSGGSREATNFKDSTEGEEHTGIGQTAYRTRLASRSRSSGAGAGGPIRHSRAKRSIVHDHFLFNHEDQRFYCAHCQANYSKHKDGSTGSLHKHLRTAHSNLVSVTVAGNVKSKSVQAKRVRRAQVDGTRPTDVDYFRVKSEFQSDCSSDTVDTDPLHFQESEFIMSSQADGHSSKQGTEVKRLSSDITLGVLGGGNMAQAILFGLFDIGAVDPNQVIVSGTSIARLDKWMNYGCKGVTDNVGLIEASDVIMWAVKPQMFPKVLDVIAKHPTRSPNKLKGKLHISVLAGLTLQTLEQEITKSFFGESAILRTQDARVARVNPNLAVKVNAGSSVYCLGKNVTADDENVIKILFAQTGICLCIDESHANAYGTLLGCGIGYMFPLLEALSDGGVKVGVPREASLKLAAQVMKGAAELYLQEGVHPAVWKDRVCSPGGTTICGIAELEKHGARNALISAVEASVNRTYEIAKK